MKRVKKILLTGISAFLIFGFISCNKKTSESAQTEIKKVDSFVNIHKSGYLNEGKTEVVQQSFNSENGLCKINKMQSYYEVFLDYTKGTPEQVGKAYAKTILTAVPDYQMNMEPYLYENIHLLLGNRNMQYDGLIDRMNALYESLPEDFKSENHSFAEEISNGERGFSENGIISYEEGILLQMVPDALRGTACSALGLWGEKTVSGKNIMCRNLEWLLGSEKQLCYYHAVVHMKKGNKSLTNITVLGLTGILTAINDDGVFAAILDVGSNNETYDYKNKKCYTFELRKALEDFTSAEMAGNFMVNSSENFTYSHNIAFADKTGAYCAEDAVEALQKSEKGYSILRKSETAIMDGLKWDSKDSLFVLNSFASQNNQDGFSGNELNMVRLAKMNNWVSSQEKFSVADVKEMLTSEVVNQTSVSNVHSRSVFHTVIVDYETGNIQVAFTSPNGVLDKPEFINIGHY